MPVLEITNLWFDREHAELGEPVLPELIGAKIKAIGAPCFPNATECGVLAIEYVPARSNQVKRLVLAFDALRMWALSSDQIAVANEDESQK